MIPKRRFPKTRFLALAIDWLVMIYLSLCVYTIVNHWYPYLVPGTRLTYRIPISPVAWIVVLSGTLLLALAWENLGISIGMRFLGIRVVRADGSAPAVSARLHRLAQDCLAFPPTIVACILASAPVAGLWMLFEGIIRKTGVSIAPWLVTWEIGPWYMTLAYTGLALGLLAVSVAVTWSLLYGVLRLLWLRHSGDSATPDQQAGTILAAAQDVEATDVKRARWFQTSSGLVILAALMLTLYVGWLITEMEPSLLFSRWAKTSHIFEELIHPDFTHMFVDAPFPLSESISGAMIETIFMALMATVFGVLFAFPLSFLGARNLMNTSPISRAVYTVIRGFFNIARSIETIIWATVIAMIVGWGTPFAGVLALAAHTIAALGKLFSEQVESIDQGPLEAMRAAGARRWQVVLYGVIPQIAPSYLAFTLYRWDINVRMSTIIGLVGGGGIGRLLFYFRRDGDYSQVAAVALLMIAVVWLMDYTSARVRERIT